MGRISRALLVMGMLLACLSAGRGQASKASQTISGGGASAGTGQPVTPAAGADSRTEKQKELERQTERLFDMATELKSEVDKTNKNILSLKVVAKAEEIEALAKGMRGQGKK